jgi:hypothetical protein
VSNNNNKSLLQTPGVVLTLASLLAPGAVTAAEIEAELRLGYGVSDNIFREELVETEEDIVTGGFSFNLIEETRRLSADIRSHIDHLNYKDNTFDEEWIGGVDAQIDITLVDERLIWVFQDNYGQRLPDPLDRPNPGNREDVNYLTTGPNFRMPVTSRGFFGIEGRYSTVSYEESPFGNDRVSGLVQMGRRMNAEADISLNLGAERVEFDNAGLSDPYDVREAFIRYENLGARDIVHIDVGYTDVETGANTASGYLLRVDWRRIVSRIASFQLGGGSQYSSEGDIFRLLQDNAREIGGTTDISGDDTPYRSHHFFTRYNLSGARTLISFAAAWTGDDYAFESALDREVTTTAFFIERDITKKFFANIDVEFRKNNYSFFDQNFDDLIISTEFGYRYSPAINVYLSFRHFKRTSDVDLGSFTESRIAVGMAYVPSWGR